MLSFCLHHKQPTQLTWSDSEHCGKSYGQSKITRWALKKTGKKMPAISPKSTQPAKSHSSCIIKTWIKTINTQHYTKLKLV